MKKNKIFSKKSLILAAVSLLLVVLLAVGTTISWIEDVSQVEFSSTDGQETPLHVGSKVLKSDAVIKDMGDNSGIINLSDYFYESGDMHLSPCYGDGENFYFPVESAGSTGFRIGTKDDANVNYLSTTFRVRSDGASTVYWFEKVNTETNYITLKKGGNEVSETDLEQYLRCSITVDGATNVYALNNNGVFRTVEAVENVDTVTTKDGRRIDQYSYYQEKFNNDGTSNTDENNAFANQGAGLDINGNHPSDTEYNLNGNTLFTVNQYNQTSKTGVKTVTVKIWLEYNNNNVAPIDVSSININLVSSWAKTRRIYVKDTTVHQTNYAQAKWLSHNGTSNNSATLFWAIKDNESTLNWKISRLNSNSDIYFVDIPAVYNNVSAVFSRRSMNESWDNSTWSNTSRWDEWKTVFPDTFHSETYTVYSKDFATWEPDDNVHSVYFVNSAFFANVYDYMWDSNSVHGSGINDKVVKNAEWPGIKMNTVMNTRTSSQNLDTYAFFYNSDYDRIIFNDGDVVAGKNQEYQTQDLFLTDSNNLPLNIVNGTFDMSTLTWFHTNPTKSDWSTKMPSFSSSNTYIYGNFSTNNQWKNTRFAYGGEYSSTTGDDFNNTSSSHMVCKIYCKAGNDYEFKLCYNGDWYGAYKNGDKRVTPNSDYYIDDDPNDPNNQWTLIPNNYAVDSHDDNHQENFIVKGINAGDILRIYFDTSEMKLYFAKGENTHY